MAGATRRRTLTPKTILEVYERPENGEHIWVDVAVHQAGSLRVTPYFVPHRCLPLVAVRREHDDLNGNVLASSIEFSFVDGGPSSFADKLPLREVGGDVVEDP